MADIEVQNVIEDKNANQRKKYKKYSSAERARIAKHAIQFGTPWVCPKVWLGLSKNCWPKILNKKF